MGEPFRVEGNKMPPNIHLGCMFSVEAECGHPDCESWRTVGIECTLTLPDGESFEVRYPVCLNHLGDFVKDRFFTDGGIVDPGPDCDDPDCPVHGNKGDDDE